MSARMDEQSSLYEQEKGATAAERQRRAAAKKCKSCNAPVIWAKTEAGKWMPLDYDHHEGGNVFLFPNGRCRVGHQEDALPQFATRHFSHFATCPHADRHRK